MAKEERAKPTRRMVYSLYLGGPDARFETHFEGPWSTKDVTRMSKHVMKGLRQYKRELWEQAEKQRRENLQRENQKDEEVKSDD